MTGQSCAAPWLWTQTYGPPPLVQLQQKSLTIGANASYSLNQLEKCTHEYVPVPCFPPIKVVYSGYPARNHLPNPSRRAKAPFRSEAFSNNAISTWPGSSARTMASRQRPASAPLANSMRTTSSSDTMLSLQVCWQGGIGEARCVLGLFHFGLFHFAPLTLPPSPHPALLSPTPWAASCIFLTPFAPSCTLPPPPSGPDRPRLQLHCV